jgi:hypothetical protein
MIRRNRKQISIYVIRFDRHFSETFFVLMDLEIIKNTFSVNLEKGIPALCLFSILVWKMVGNILSVFTCLSRLNKRNVLIKTSLDNFFVHISVLLKFQFDETMKTIKYRENTIYFVVKKRIYNLFLEKVPPKSLKSCKYITNRLNIFEQLCFELCSCD